MVYLHTFGCSANRVIACYKPVFRGELLVAGRVDVINHTSSHDRNMNPAMFKTLYAIPLYWWVYRDPYIGPLSTQ